MRVLLEEFRFCSTLSEKFMHFKHKDQLVVYSRLGTTIMKLDDIKPLFYIIKKKTVTGVMDRED